jgi:hypothetical protein
MKVPGTTTASVDQDLTGLDDALARLEHGLTVERRPEETAATANDLLEFEEAFDRIDRQLNGDVAPLGALTLDGEEELAAVEAQVAEPLPLDSTEPVAVATPKPVLALVAPAATTSETPHRLPRQHEEFDEPWRKPAGGGAPLERLVGTIQNLLWLGRAIESRSTKIAQHMQWDQAGEVLSDALMLCDEFDLPTARVRAGFAIDAFHEDRLDVLAFEIKELVRHLQHDLETSQVVPVLRQRAWVLTLTLDARANTAFPAAAIEVTAASRCMALGLHGAAIFHFLRAAERGRAALARAVRIDARRTAATDWSTTGTAVHKRMMALRRWPAGPARKSAKDFLNAVLSDVRGFEDLRRRVNEGEVFEDCHAVAAWYATRDFLALAAERVADSCDALLSPDDFIPRS